MVIGELNENTVVTITVTDGEGLVKLESRTIKPDKECIEFIQKAAESLNFKSFAALELMKEENKVINFLSAKVKCYLTAEKDTKPYQFPNVKIIKLNLPELGYHHIAFCNEDTESFNRRHEFRLWLGYDALIKINDSKVPHKGVVKDISFHGGGFILDEEYDVKQGDILHIQFHESSYSKLKKDYVTVMYTCIYSVVRVIPLKNNKVLAGCVSEIEEDEINKFIAKKQREKLSVGGKNPLAKKVCDADLIKALESTAEGN